MINNKKTEQLKAGFGKLYFEATGSGSSNTRNFCLFLAAVIIVIGVGFACVVLAAKFGWLTPLTLGSLAVAIIRRGVKAIGKGP